MMQQTEQANNPSLSSLKRGREKFIKHFDDTAALAEFFDIPPEIVRGFDSGFSRGYRRAGDDEILKTFASSIPFT